MRPGEVPIEGYMAGHAQDLIGNPEFTGAACRQLLPTHNHRFMRRTVLRAVPHQIDAGDWRQIAWPETLLRSAGLHTTSISSSTKKPGTSARYCQMMKNGGTTLLRCRNPQVIVNQGDHVNFLIPAAHLRSKLIYNSLRFVTGGIGVAAGSRNPVTPQE